MDTIITMNVNLDIPRDILPFRALDFGFFCIGAPLNGAVAPHYGNLLYKSG